MRAMALILTILATLPGRPAHGLAPGSAKSFMAVSEPRLPIRLARHLADLKALEALGDAYVDEFEKELDTAGPNWWLHASSPYQSLLSIRELMEQLQNEVEDLVSSMDLPALEAQRILRYAANPSTYDQFRRQSLSQLINDNESIHQKIEALKAGRNIFSATTQIGAQISPSKGSSGNLIGSEFPPETWAITFDDGPHPKYTEQILTMLDRQKVKATFFWLARNVLRYQKIVDRAGREGHARENHSFSHPRLTRVSATGLKHEVAESSEIMTSRYQEKPKFFRCPHGEFNDRVRDMIAKQNMVHVFWNVDSLDWKIKDPARVKAFVLKQMQRKRGGIVLFHDIKPKTSDVADQILTKHRDKRWVTIPQIVEEMNR